MPVIFSTPSSHDVLMLDKDANTMLKAMKTSGKIPGALFPDDVSDSLKSLEVYLKNHSDEETPSENQDDTDEDYVGVNKKAFPLLEIMKSAIENEEKLTWDNG